jgi:glyoxylase-like metal-dependent hydrolase (beta-lactamase superfamily II)
MPPDTSKFDIIDVGTPEEHEELLHIGDFTVADLQFEVLEGSGGHLYGEMVFVCKKAGIAFTGDNLVNIKGFSPERAEFNSLAPFLMTSVNVNSKKATEIRQRITVLAEEIGKMNKKPCIICGGHGPISVLDDGGLQSLQNTETITLE